MFPRRLLPSLIVFSLASCLAQADTIKLKSGEILRGTITEESAASVTIVYEAAKGILDEKKIPRAEIEQAVKEDPSDRAWAEISAKLPTPDFMVVSEYDHLIQKVQAFITGHGTSMKASEARRLLELLRDERGRITAGGLKLDGKWITPEHYQREKFWVDGRIALKQFSDATKAGRSVEALRLFEKIEAGYKGTTIFVRAVETAKIALNRYSAAISEAILNQPQLEKQRRDGLASLSPADKRATEEAQAAQAAALKVRAEEEVKSGTKWLTLDPYNLPDLQAAKKTLDAETARLGSLNLQGADEQEAILRQIDQAITQGRLDVADQLIREASAGLSGMAYFKALQDRARAEAARLSAEKKAADAARAEAARRAAETLPSTPPLPKEKDKDPLEDAVNPLAKAVLESDLGKRVNKETPAPATSPEAITPPSTPSSADSTGPSSTQQAPEITPPAPTTSSPTAPPKKKTDGGMTTILYGLAGLLFALLVALLLTPLFKKKAPQEEVAAPFPDQEPELADDDENGDAKQG